VGDGASVEDNKVGGSGVTYGEVALVRKRGFDSRAVGLRGTAAEALDEDALHVFSVNAILNCVCAVGQLLEEPRKRRIERKVRSS